jgi:hypothetical protein
MKTHLMTEKSRNGMECDLLTVWIWFNFTSRIWTTPRTGLLWHFRSRAQPLGRFYSQLSSLSGTFDDRIFSEIYNLKIPVVCKGSVLFAVSASSFLWPNWDSISPGWSPVFTRRDIMGIWIHSSAPWLGAARNEVAVGERAGGSSLRKRALSYLRETIEREAERSGIKSPGKICQYEEIRHGFDAAK